MGIIGALSSGTGSSAGDRRQLAVDLFNEVWTLIEAPDRTPEDDDRMLHAAHASRFHWGEAGTGVNLVRGEWQCARVYSVLGRAEPAVHHARRCLELCSRHEVEDFDLPYAHEGLARAYALAGDAASAAHHAALAREVGERIADAEDRALFLRDLSDLL